MEDKFKTKQFNKIWELVNLSEDLNQLVVNGFLSPIKTRESKICC